MHELLNEHHLELLAQRVQAHPNEPVHVRVRDAGWGPTYLEGMTGQDPRLLESNAFGPLGVPRYQTLGEDELTLYRQALGRPPHGGQRSCGKLERWRHLPPRAVASMKGFLFNQRIEALRPSDPSD